MIDPGPLGFIIAMAFVAMAIVFNVFKWGYNKEARGERTDFLGRPNNHMKKNNNKK